MKSQILAVSSIILILGFLGGCLFKQVREKSTSVKENTTLIDSILPSDRPNTSRIPDTPVLKQVYGRKFQAEQSEQVRLDSNSILRQEHARNSLNLRENKYYACEEEREYSRCDSARSTVGNIEIIIEPKKGFFFNYYQSPTESIPSKAELNLHLKVDTRKKDSMSGELYLSSPDRIIKIQGKFTEKMSSERDLPQQ
ncbi:MAG: hypothetical protein QNJ54_31885 [Prochloraceae cyanobacterium]|nr:hypothetical protein [Prochloraceae cyanobacterium]